MSQEIVSPELAAAEAALRRSGFAPRSFTPLPGDVSPRRYVRLELERGGTAILALYPPEIASVCGRFQRTSSLLTDAGVRVPRILDCDCEGGWMLVEDLGPQTLGDRRDLPWG